MSDESKGFVSVEATGIYEGTLLEDMITTVQRTKKLVCDVDIPELFNKDYPHPYVYVPIWAMSLPLREGDKVQVIFNQGDYLYPVLYKNPADLPEGFTEKNFPLPKGMEGGNVKIPDTEDNICCQWLGVDSYIIKTNSYTILHQNNGFILLQHLDEGDKVFIYGDEINLSSSGKLNIDSVSEVKIKSSSTVTINDHFQVLA